MQEFTEIQNFGFNSITITSTLTILCTVFQGYGTIKQSQKMWKERSCQSLSAVSFFYCCFYFLAFLVYGLSKNSLAMAFNGLLGFLYLPIMAGFINFGKLDWKQKLSIPLLSLIVPIMIFARNKDFFLLFLLVGTGAVLLAQLWELIRTGVRGVIDLRYIITFLVTNVLWFIFALSIKNLLLMIFNGAAILIYVFVVFLYWKYGQDEKKKLMEA